MPWKDTPEFRQEDWTKRLEAKRRLDQRLQLLLKGVLGLALVTMAYFLIMVMLQKPVLEDPGEGESKLEASPASPDSFAPGDLRKIDLAEERNFAALVAVYGKEVGTEALDSLKRVDAALRAEKFEVALREADQMVAETPSKIREAVRAVALTRLSREKEARKAFMEASKELQPAEFYFEFGVFYLGRNDLADAYEQFATGARRAKSDVARARLHVAAGQVAFEREKWRDVVTHVDAAATAAKEIPEDLLVNACVAEVHAGKQEAAIRRCRKFLLQMPEAHQLRAFLARVLAARGRLDEALAVFGELRNKHPDENLVRREMVRAYQFNERHEEAVSLAAEVAQRDRNNPQLQAWYGVVLAAAGKPEQAIAILKGIEGDLKDHEAAILRSLTEQGQNDLDAAAEALEPFHTIDPLVAMRWATLKIEQGEATDELRAILVDHQLNAAQWKQLAATAGRHEDLDMAAFALERAVEEGDTSLETLNRLALATIQDPTGFDFVKVEAACRQALAANPANPDILYTFGLAMLKDDRPGSCAQLLVEHYVVTESSAPLSLLLGQAYRALRANPSARQAFVRCLELMEGASDWSLPIGREEIEEQIASLPK